MKSMAPLVLLGLFSLTLSSEQKTKSNTYCWGQLSPPNLAKIWLHMYLCDLGTLITESHISFFCRSASRGGFFSGERLKKPKNGRSNDHRHSKKCENDHRFGGQFRVFLNPRHWKFRRRLPLFTQPIHVSSIHLLAEYCSSRKHKILPGYCRHCTVR